MDKQPNQLDPVVTLADTDVLVVQQTADNGVKQATIQQLKAAALTGDWTQLNVVPTVTTGYNKGQKEHDVTYANINLSTFISAGQKMKVDRTGTTPTQCTDLESTSSQYASKTSPSGVTFLDDFTAEAWVKLESYADMWVIGRADGTIANGWRLGINSSGQIFIQGVASGTGANRAFQSYQSLPLAQWMHIAVTLDMSGVASTSYINGVSVSSTATASAGSALVQSGDLSLGRSTAAGSYFDGKMSDVRVWSVVRTATQIRDNMNQQLVGNETNLVAYFKLNGNFNDSTSNGNNLTAAGSAVATNVDHPFHTTEYGYVTKVAYSAPNTVVTIFTGTDCNIPNMTLQNPYYSGIDAPYGFPRDSWKWGVESIYCSVLTSPSLSASVWTAMTGASLLIPVGSWSYGYRLFIQQNSGSSGSSFAHASMATSAPATNNYTDKTTTGTYDSGAQFQGGNVEGKSEVAVTAQTTHNLYVTYSQGNATVTTQIRSDLAATVMYAKCAYAN